MFILSSIGVESKKRENFTKLITKTKQKYHSKKNSSDFLYSSKAEIFPSIFQSLIDAQAGYNTFQSSSMDQTLAAFSVCVAA